MITVKLKICFDSGQFVGGAKNLKDQFVQYINFGKSKRQSVVLCFTSFSRILNQKDTRIFSRILKRAVILISKNLWKFLERQRM